MKESIFIIIISCILAILISTGIKRMLDNTQKQVDKIEVLEHKIDSINNAINCRVDSLANYIYD